VSVGAYVDVGLVRPAVKRGGDCNEVVATATVLGARNRTHNANVCIASVTISVLLEPFQQATNLLAGLGETIARETY
jgi:hypothetical protein